MKKIPLLTVDTEITEGNPQKLHYATMLRQILMAAPQGGAGIAMEDGIKASDIGRIIRRADEAGRDSVMLEDDHHAMLLGKLNSFRWAFFSDEIADLCRAVRDAATIDPNAPAPDAALETNSSAG